MTVRTRFAPSPTGDPHVGNLRTALFAWALARANDGQFILRIEDTDRKRLVHGSVERIFESLRWLGIEWDEGPDVGGPFGPYMQSERLDVYHRVVDQLIADGQAYRCFCTADRLDQLRALQAAAKQPPGYDGFCRDVPPDESAARAVSEPFVVRFRMQDEGVTVLHDAVRGEVRFDNALQDDFVALKSDGYPTYHLAAIVDDHLMGITHVTRTDEWLSSAPKHLQLNAALGFTPPIYAHLPLILGPDHKKLSKRTGDTAALDYREKGYLPDAMVNFLALLGWSLDDHTTIISRDELLANFALERVVANPAIFDIERLDYLNGQYIRAMSDDDWLAVVRDWCERDLPPRIPRPLDDEVLVAAAPLLKERAGHLTDIAPALEFLFGYDPPEYETSLLWSRIGDEQAALDVLDAALVSLDDIDADGWDREAIESAIRGLETALDMKLRRFVSVLYVAVMGKPQGIPLFDSLEILGRDRTVARLRAARAGLG